MTRRATPWEPVAGWTTLSLRELLGGRHEGGARPRLDTRVFVSGRVHVLGLCARPITAFMSAIRTTGSRFASRRGDARHDPSGSQNSLRNRSSVDPRFDTAASISTRTSKRRLIGKYELHITWARRAVASGKGRGGRQAGTGEIRDRREADGSVLP